VQTGTLLFDRMQKETNFAATLAVYRLGGNDTQRIETGQRYSILLKKLQAISDPRASSQSCGTDAQAQAPQPGFRLLRSSVVISISKQGQIYRVRQGL
jgi:hypothetical protein